ncbi:MAG: wax ester/triacylglycerol synthase family O-acyltransferase [Actinobacteria bacterium]|nr:wax ester/triacylglycerol synthase family O-acyltransferase [Actinomycetota bacterium]
MSDVEALMWTLEKDPFLSSAFANLTTFDRVPDLDRLLRRMERAVRAVPRLRQRVVASFGRFAPPGWYDDPDFDLRYHVRRVDLPPPGNRAQLLDLAARLASDPFDRTRPLWEFVVVGGLEDGRGAMVQRMHHTITDGEGGVRLSLHFLDAERDAPEPAPPESGDGPEPHRRSLAGDVADAVGHNVRRQFGIARRAATEAAGVATDPGRLLRAPAEVVAGTSSLLRQAVVRDERRSPLWTRRSLRHRVEVGAVPFDDVKRAAKSLGGSINDVFVCAAAGAAGAYHRARGVDVAELRMAMPVSTRQDRTAGGNAFTPARLLVPVRLDPVERFAAIHGRLSDVKGERALSLAAPLAGVMNLLPTSLLVQTARRQVETVDFTTSNVRGAPFPLYIAGARIEHNHPLGPLGGTAFNLTTLSYNGSLDLGLHVDEAAVDDAAELMRLIEDAFVELFDTASAI